MVRINDSDRGNWQLSLAKSLMCTILRGLWRPLWFGERQPLARMRPRDSIQNAVEK